MAAVNYLNNITQMGSGASWSPILPQGSWLVSPSGLFNGVQQNDGNFVVSHGTTPGTGPVLWASGTSTGNATAPFQFAAFTTQYGNLASQLFLNDGSTPAYSQNVGAPDYFLSRPNGTLGTYFTSVSDNGVLAVNPGSSGNATGGATVQSNKSDPLKSLNIQTINYDFDHVTYNSIQTQYGATAVDHNDTATRQTYPISLDLTYTNSSTFDWSLSQATELSVSSEEQIGVPGIGDASLTEGITSTTTLSSGQSTTTEQSQTYTAGGEIAVPAYTTYTTTITGQKVNASVPYSFTGIALYNSGITAPVFGTGVFQGVSTGVFDTETTCTASPTNCLPIAPEPTPVPEPASVSVLLMAACATLSVRYSRRRGRRARV